MSLRPFALLGLSLLLAACSSQPETPEPPSASTPPATASARQALPAGQRELRGSLLGAPANSEVELALLVVDERGRPQEELGSTHLPGNGQALPFNLHFRPQASVAGLRIELRGRVSQSGRLILRLPPRTLSAMDSQALGTLQLVPAP